MDARVLKNRLQEVRKSNFKKSENQTSGSSKIKPQEVGESNPNYTNYNQTNYNQTEYSYIYPSIYQREDEIDGQDGLMDDKTNVH